MVRFPRPAVEEEGVAPAAEANRELVHDPAGDTHELDLGLVAEQGALAGTQRSARGLLEDEGGRHFKGGG